MSSSGADQQSRLNAWHAFLVAHAALEPILNRELEAACGLPLRWFDVLTPSGEKTLKRAAPIHEDGIRRHFAAYIRDDEAAAVEAALARIAAAARQDDSLASQAASTGT